MEARSEEETKGHQVRPKDYGDQGGCGGKYVYTGLGVEGNERRVEDV